VAAHAAPVRAASGVPKRASTPTKASALNAKVPAAATGAKDPLEEAIRKAVAQGK